MSDFNLKYPVEGSAALRVPAPEAEETLIIDFPLHERHPKHARLDNDHMARGTMRTAAHQVRERVLATEMVDSLVHGTCAGKPVGKMTSVQAAGASLAFFLVFMGTLLFV